MLGSGGFGECLSNIADFNDQVRLSPLQVKTLTFPGDSASLNLC